ncbi:hypothetical protein [Chryseobacterium paridis]|uniref:Outer membrane protein beta-barrel domain-containing protein n=1 Tax=Chryseobacterium paridis TaxID=2800328 RepID=A0ABS1FZ87_9FLAO|nr:hypothetical protein [Chryseobacterium paridis]MBK1897767.1 hypothetical protein [Chryseobacterium paridis]
MKVLALCALMVVNLHAQVLTESTKKERRSMVEAGSFLSFSSYKESQMPGVYVGYWHRFPIDENKAHLEFGLNFYHSTSIYDFDYGKNGELYHVRSKEFLLNIGLRMVKEYPVRSNSLEWVSELSMHNLFFSGNGIPGDKPEKDNGNTIYVDTNTRSIASIRMGQGIRFWKNNFGLGIQGSYMPFRLLQKNAVPSGFNSFSIETSIYFKF